MSILGSEIDDIKSVFSKRQGPAHTNRFMIFMQPPKTNLLNLDVNAAITAGIGTILNGGFSVDSLLGFINDPRDVSFLCENCTLPGRSVVTTEYANVKQAVKVPYTYMNEDVSFTFLLTGDYYMKKMFDAWLALVFNTESYELQYKDTYTTDVRIVQLNKNNIPVYTVKLENAYPIAINAITMDNAAESTIQRVTINMTYENYVVEGLVDAVKGIAGEIGQAATGAIEQVGGLL